MKKTALVIMAAGIGSRFGKGIKQLAPVGPNGEIIMDYSIHDAIEAGFNKVVFIIRKDIKDAFHNAIGKRIEGICNGLKVEFAYAYQDAAMHVADFFDAIYVQERTDDTDKQCKEAKEAWDKLTDAQEELVEGENADPDYFGRDTGDASKDDPRNQDDIGENEILVVSFGTSFNDSRVADIKCVEDAIAAANPDWSVRRAFTAQIIINHVQARDDEKIDNMDQALERAV